MDRIYFTVNGQKCSVGSEVDSDVSLNDYLRNFLNLRGTKYMCKEGGCGACIVSTVVEGPTGDRRTKAVNSCLVSVTSCEGWDITTIEGIGDRRKGFHPVQRTLAEYNGTQCGYCSVGFVMNMYSLLESNRYNLTQYEIEKSFGSNTCRCTGYRPILDAFKSFAKDSPKPNVDIEDLKLCGGCKGPLESKEWCFVKKIDKDKSIKKIKLKDDKIWYRVLEIKDVFGILESEGVDSYMLVNGNTGKGAVPITAYPRVLIDISPIDELKTYYIDQNLVVGAGTALTDLMEIFKNVSHNYEEFAYLEKLYEHLDLVAHIPVRNIGTIAGNLMLKHRLPTFSSDVFLLFESVGAILTIVSKDRTVELSPRNFLTMNMIGHMITQVKLPPLSKDYKFVSFKIMPRSQSAHAQVNGAFLYKFDSHHPEVVQSARIVITGLSAQFVHAHHTEAFVANKQIFTNEVLQGALKVLEKELIVEEIPAELSAEYRKKCALGIFYKGLLNLIPDKLLDSGYRSGARDFRKTRPVSKGTEVYDTNPEIWPITEPSPKVEALIQTSGEAKYINDTPTQPGEVFCAFVTSDICIGEILEIDPTPALKIPGVLAFFSAKDIPGVNSFMPIGNKFSGITAPEEIFADKIIKYYDQAIGLIVAETERLANRAALLVHIKYKKDEKELILTIDDAKKKDPSRINILDARPASDRGLNVTKVIKHNQNIYGQYHYSMETQTCITRPSDDGIDMFPSTQWPNIVHVATSQALNLEQSRINLEVFRCGGAYGSRITRANHIAAACALVTYKLNRPCRFVMSIQANMKVIGKRVPCTEDFEVGVNDSGEIQYLELHLYEDLGYVFSEPVFFSLERAARSCYDNRRWAVKFFTVITDTAHNTFARGPGSVEGISMAEFLMERITYGVDRDPLEVRLNNLAPQNRDVAEMVQTLVRDSEYEKRKEDVRKFNKENRWKKRGLRVALMNFPAENTTNFHVLLSVYHGDGTVVVKHGGIEMGQGINTKVIQTVAYTLNINRDKVKVKSTDSASNPNTYTSAGSRSTQSVCFGAIKCCQLLLDRLSILRASLNNPTWEDLTQNAYRRGINLQTSYFVNGNDQQIYRAGGACVTEVELDILTGEHEVLRVDIIEDVGTSTNPEIDIGQIEGAFIMGLGYWTHEHLIYDHKTGEQLTDRTWNYHVPITKDIPIDFRIQLRRNSFNPVGTLGAKIVAEPAITMAISVAHALRAAIAASREDSGRPRNEWFDVDGPYTLEPNVLKADVDLKEFVYK